MSLWSTALSPGMLSEYVWVDLMPWLDRYGSARNAQLAALAPDERWWERRSPAETAASADVVAICGELARIYVTEHPDLVFSAGIADTVDVPVAALGLGTRAAATVARLPRAATTAGLLGYTPAALFSVRGAGPETVHQIVQAVLVLAILRDPASLRVATDAPTLPPALSLLLDDLVALARWRGLRADPDRPLVRVELEDGAPEEIQQVAARIAALTARDLPLPAPPRALDELAAYVAGLAAPERDAIRRRVLGDEPPDPDAPSTFAFGTAVGDLLAALRVDVRPVATLERILASRPELAQPVPGLEVPLWRALARLDDRFEVVDGWVAVPGLAEAERRTHALLAEFESPNGVVEPAAVAVVWNLPAAEFAAWLRRCGVPMFEGRALTRRSAFADHAAAVLEVIGDPLTAAELVDRMGTPAGPAAVIDAMGADERFSLAEDDRWALTEWETDEENAVRGRIARIVDADGGAADLGRVVDRLVERFGVSPTSARIFAGSGDFEIVDGRVRRRRRTHVSIKPPHRTRRLYRLGDVWRLRVTATRDHLRGADFPVPSAVAGVVGCVPGREVALSSRLGTQVVRWTGASPHLGSVRRFLEDLGVDEGNEMFLEFHPGGRFDVLPLRTVADNAEPLRKALALIGHSAPEIVPEDGVAPAFAAAVGLGDETRPRRVLSAYRARHEAEVTALLEQAWVRVPS